MGRETGRRDNVRWTFFRNDPWLSRKFGENIVEESARSFFRPLWNVYSFFVTYATLDNFKPQDVKRAPQVTNILDRWILSELEMLTSEVTDFLEKYDITPATKALERFIDDLSNWYVRRSRRRFWKSENDQDKNQAEQTLYYVLVKLSLLLAPLAPFVAEEMYRNLTRGGLYLDERGAESVHLSDWPRAGEQKVDQELVNQMRLARRVVSFARAARQEADIRVRQPLQSVQIAAKTDHLSKEVEELVKDEINVKEINYVDDPQKLGIPQIKINFAAAGKKYGAQVKKMQQMIKQGDYTMKGETVRVDGQTLDVEDVLIQYQAKKGLAVAGVTDLLVGLDIKPGPELVREGLVREIIRAVQELRKKADFEVSDRIELALVTKDSELAAALTDFEQEIMTETLAKKISPKRLADAAASIEFIFEDHKAWLGVKKI